MKNNPYIGPRPFQRGERRNFYGRNREARDLLALVKAERVVLFYAQSGAGKTSLLNAQIIPELEEEGFHVLPVARVGGDLPPGVDQKSVSNIFVFSAIMGLTGQDNPAEALVHHTLASFLREYCVASEGEDEKLPILILDQFEEILTTHRDRWQEARGFFEQLAEALREITWPGWTLTPRLYPSDCERASAWNCWAAKGAGGDHKARGASRLFFRRRAWRGRATGR